MRLICRGVAAIAIAWCALPVASPMPLHAQAPAVVRCESNGSLKVCPTGTTWRGARLVAQISKTPCLQNENWGFDGRGVWVDKGCRGSFVAADPLTNAGQRVTCASAGGKRTDCPADARFGATLVKQLSDAPCKRNSTWGTTSRGIWVDKGCRAEFMVDRGPPPQQQPPVSLVQRITCGDPTPGQVQCLVSGRATAVRLIRDLSGGRCRSGETWGFTPNTVWTTGACRADFEVTVAGTPGVGASTGALPGPQVITCGVTNGQYAACKAGGTIKDVRLMRDLSGAGRCQPPQNWGHSSAEVWTRNGCRGEFQVTLQTAPGTLGRRAPAAVRIIACGLASGQRTECKTGGTATDVRLVKDLSGGGCRQGFNWGHSDTFIWASRGCRGQFQVTYRPDRDEPR